MPAQYPDVPSCVCGCVGTRASPFCYCQAAQPVLTSHVGKSGVQGVAEEGCWGPCQLSPGQSPDDLCGVGLRQAAADSSLTL